MKIINTIIKSALVVATVTAAVSAKDYSGAELYTKTEFTYGKFEARMQMAAVSGTVSSMFLYQNGSEQASAERWVEVDIEVLGKDPGQFQSNIITGKAGAQVTSEKLHQVNPATTQAFHTYGIEWTPDYVRWTVDGKEVRKTTKGQNDSKNQVQNLIGTQGLRFNLWSSESADWVGNFDPNQLPIFQFINWVKVYKYTPGQGPDGSDFTLDWTDNFDTFDASRWAKGDWTFDGNRVDLTDKNIYSKDGMLILALTRKGQEQFNGQVPKDDESQSQQGEVNDPNANQQNQQGNQQGEVNDPNANQQNQQGNQQGEVNDPNANQQNQQGEVNDPNANQQNQQGSIEAIQKIRDVKKSEKAVRGYVNVKGARVKDANQPYRVNFGI